jgi:hypothetical protein
MEASRSYSFPIEVPSKQPGPVIHSPKKWAVENRVFELKSASLMNDPVEFGSPPIHTRFMTNLEKRMNAYFNDE